MAKRSEALLSTDRQVATARMPEPRRICAEYRIQGVPNLVLRVMASGRRSWTYVLKRPKTGRWAKYNLGPYPAVSFARARDEATRLKRAVIDGVDPFDVRTAGSGILSMKELGDAYIARHAKTKKRSWAEDARMLEKDVVPVLGSARADLVTKSDVVRLLDTIVDRGAPIQANRTLALVRKLFNWAQDEGYLHTANPAQRVPSRAKETSRSRVLSEAEIRALWHALDGPGFDGVTADALRLQFLLGARVKEVTGMMRTELSVNGTMWTLPATRSKGGKAVPRPLPPLAAAIVQRRLKAAGDSPFLFVSPKLPSQPIERLAPARAIKRAAEKGLIPAGFTPHDLRRTCRTFWAKLGIPETVAKKLLGHVPPRSDVTASVYDQHAYVDEMLAALVLWGERLMRIVAVDTRAPATVRASASARLSPPASS